MPEKPDIAKLWRLMEEAKTALPWERETFGERSFEEVHNAITDANSKRVCDTMNSDGACIEGPYEGFYIETGTRAVLEFIVAVVNALPWLLAAAEEREFWRKVLAFFAAIQEHNSLWWRVEDGRCRWFITCSDFFYWGSADCEEITPENFALLEQSVADCQAVYEDEIDKAVSGVMWGQLLFAARARKHRPQGACYPHNKELWPLFDAAGPDYPKGIGNPYAPGEYPKDRGEYVDDGTAMRELRAVKNERDRYRQLLEERAENAKPLTRERAREVYCQAKDAYSVAWSEARHGEGNAMCAPEAGELAAADRLIELLNK